MAANSRKKSTSTPSNGAGPDTLPGAIPDAFPDAIPDTSGDSGDSGEKKKRHVVSARTEADGLGPNFDEFYAAYPRKVGRPAAAKAYSRSGDGMAARDAAQHDEIMQGLARWRRHWEASGTDLKYIPHPSTWLNDRRWEDDPFEGGVGSEQEAKAEEFKRRIEAQQREIE